MLSDATVTTAVNLGPYAIAITTEAIQAAVQLGVTVAVQDAPITIGVTP